MKKIVFIEPNFDGVTHFNVNRSFLLAHINTYPEREIHVVADKSHIDNIAQGVEKDISAHYLDYESETKKIHRSGWNYYLAPWRRLAMYFKLLKGIKLKTEDNLFFASNNEFDFFCGWLLSKIYKGINISFVCHANLNQIYTWQSKNPVRRFFQYKTALLRLAYTKIKLVCLEEAVAKNLLAELPALKRNIAIIPHPIDEKTTPQELEQENKKDKLAVAFVGILSKEKRPELFEALTHQLDANKYNFIVAGWAHKPDDYNLQNCTQPPKSSPLKQEDMLELLRKSDLICMLHDPEHYKLSASGVLLDAIKFMKPIIHLNSELVLDIEKTYGSIGFTASTIEELVNVLNESSDQDMLLRIKNLDVVRKTRLYGAMKKNISILFESH